MPNDWVRSITSLDPRCRLRTTCFDQVYHTSFYLEKEKTVSCWHSESLHGLSQRPRTRCPYRCQYSTIAYTRSPLMASSSRSSRHHKTSSSRGNIPRTEIKIHVYDLLPVSLSFNNSPLHPLITFHSRPDCPPSSGPSAAPSCTRAS